MTVISERKTRLVIETPLSERSWGSRSVRTNDIAGYTTSRQKVKLDRAVIAEVMPWGMMMRLKGTRSGHSISWANIWNKAQENTARAKVEQRKAERKAKKAGRR